MWTPRSHCARGPGVHSSRSVQIRSRRSNIRLTLGIGVETRQTRSERVSRRRSQRNPNSMHLLLFVILLVFYKNFLYQFWIQCNPPSPRNLPLRSAAALTIGSCKVVTTLQKIVWGANRCFFPTAPDRSNLCEVGIFFHRSIRLGSLYRRVRCMDA